ncbi:S-layer homology domain-containing protein [Paenibacillus pasadenensis]|uniref:Putative signaling protein n=1 Tax=Paenibacillus pasadenensis TaxID=217090 RepID=A0A2N5N7Y7_9BACL|nr:MULTISPECIES: S-layer homology domain-containing protein [Paenibacillus]PLT46409.1 putative signaling protein [Paenibacillus pasadenensis]
MTRNRKKSRLLAGGLAAALLLAAAPLHAGAFADVEADPNAAAIRSLEQAGLLSGGDGKFRPAEALTNAEGIALLVKAFGLNLDRIRFIQAPQASQYYPGMSDSAWYSESFLIGAALGVGLPKDVKPGAPMSRETFAALLLQAMKAADGGWSGAKGEAPEDDSAVGSAYRDSVLELIGAGLPLLDPSGNFQPKKAVSRSDAAAWVEGGRKLVKGIKPESESPSPVSPLAGVELTTAKLADGVVKVTVSAQAPNPGYGIRIASIRFDGGQAIVSVAVVRPKPGQMYPQVITEVSADTYVDEAYTAVLDEAAASSGEPLKGGILPGKNAR